MIVLPLRATMLIFNFFFPAEGENLARQFGCKFIETSAKSRINVDKAFYSLATEIKKDMDVSKAEQAGSKGVNIDNQNGGAGGSLGKSCC